MTLTGDHVLGLSIFSSYIVVIFLLFFTVISSIRKYAKPEGKLLPALAFVGLTLASFAHTWFWMFRFMAWSFRTYEATHKQRNKDLLVRVASWLSDTALFEQAWAAVCTGPINWWWSEQLCLFTAGAFTVFLFLQRERVPHLWAYMLIGQLVAISVAWSLLNLALVLIPCPPASTKTRRTLPLLLTVPVLLSMLTISLAPYTTPATFLPNLLAMHALVVLPLLPLPHATPHSLAPRSTSFYTLLAVLAALLRVRTTLAVLSVLRITSSPFFSWRYPADLALALWMAPAKVFAAGVLALHTHPAQASIGWDVVWTGVVWTAWGAVVGEGMEWSAGLQGAFASLGVVAPLEFGRVLREEERVMSGDGKEE